MLSYSQRGMKTMNQDQRTLSSSLNTRRMRNMRQMNHVKSALCSTAILLQADAVC